MHLAEEGEPQLVTHNGRDAVVALSAEEYARLTVPESLVEFMRRSPLAEVLAEDESILGDRYRSSGLADLLERVTPENVHPEIDDGPNVE